MRPKLTVAASFPISPVRGGGQVRVAGLYGGLATHGVDVDVVTPGTPDEPPEVVQLAPGLRELRVPITRPHQDALDRLQATVGTVPVGDIGFALHHRRTPAYAAAVRASARTARAVVACHPFAIEVLAEAAPDLPLIYEAQDVETDLKAQLLGPGHHLVDVVAHVEQLACRRAGEVVACTAPDAERLAERFAIPSGVCRVVPNGVALDAVPFVPLDDRAGGRPIVVFVGSWHGPNVAAAELLMRIAQERPQLDVRIIGSVGGALADTPVPPNVTITGPVDRSALHELLARASVAVNPMAEGSGSNLKLLEYGAAGVPVVSTAFGARGFLLEPEVHYVEAAPDAFGDALDRLLDEPVTATRARVGRLHAHVRAAFGWDAIAGDWLAASPVLRDRCAA